MYNKCIISLCCRNNNVNNAEDVDYDLEILKPCTALYEEAKCLLQQAV